MTTLGTNQTQLSQLERRRSLAAALQQQAMNGQPLLHPLQALGKLAQAFAASKINQSVASQEKDIAKQRQQAFADALAPNIIDVPTRAPGEGRVIGEVAARPGDIAGVDVADFNQLGTGDPFRVAVPKTPEEILAALPPELAEQATVDIIKARLMQTAKDPEFERVGLRDITLDDGVSFQEGEVFRDKSTSQLFIKDAQGKVTPLGSRQVRGPVERRQDVPLTTSDFQEFEKTAETAQVAFSQIDRLIENIHAGGLTGDTALGGARQMLDEMAATFSGLKMTFDRDQDKVFLERSFYETFVTTAADRKKYSPETIAANAAFHKRFSALDAENQQIAISLAYTLARIADPGGRLSEMDVLNQMRSLQLDSPVPERRIVALRSVEEEFATRIDTRLFFLNQRAARGGQTTPDLPPGMQDRIDRVLGRGQEAVAPINTLSELTPEMVQFVMQAEPQVQQQFLNALGPEERAAFKSTYPNLARQLGL
jgi:hypothetical protein